MTNATTMTAGAGFFGTETRSGLARSWANYTTYRRTLAELRNLSDRDLADLGMDRSGLRAIAHAAVYGN